MKKTSRPSSRKAAAARGRGRPAGRVALPAKFAAAARKAAAAKSPAAGRKAAGGREPMAAAGRAARGRSPAVAPAGDAAPIRIARIAKGRKPQYFSDPATDKLLWMTLTLMEELSVTRDRLDAVENLLEQRRVLKVSDVDAFQPRGAAAERRQRRRADYVDRMLRAAQAELEELTGRDMPKSEAEAVAAVEA